MRTVDAVGVDGRSMLPTLAPGDQLLIESRTFQRRRPRVGDIVVVADPRRPARELVKRVVGVDADGRVEVRGDAPSMSTDSRTFGPIPASRIRWRVRLRYWPLARIGLL